MTATHPFPSLHTLPHSHLCSKGPNRPHQLTLFHLDQQRPSRPSTSSTAPHDPTSPNTTSHLSHGPKLIHTVPHWSTPPQTDPYRLTLNHIAPHWSTLPETTHIISALHARISAWAPSVPHSTVIYGRPGIVSAAVVMWGLVRPDTSHPPLITSSRQ